MNRALPGGPFEIDRLIHEPLRLGIVTALATVPSLTFVELKSRLETTDGNLSVHARKLEAGGYVSCTKTYEGKVARTEFRLTHAGRKALERYVERMDAILAGVRGQVVSSST
ncbi:MAG TPA: transcriptional regulator [Vicinamibacterales bacterium]